MHVIEELLPQIAVDGTGEMRTIEQSSFAVYGLSCVVRHQITC